MGRVGHCLHIIKDFKKSWTTLNFLVYNIKVNYSEKWNLTEDEWNLISCLPFHVSYSIAKADGVLNKEEIEPFIGFRENIIRKTDNTAIVDMCLVSKDRQERNINDGQIISEYLDDYGLKNADGSYLRKELIVDHFLRVLNLFDELNREKIKEYCFHLALQTAYAYGVPSQPADETEKSTMNELFRWLEIDITKFSEQNNRENFFNYLNGTTN